MTFNESDFTVSDSNNSSLFDNLGSFSLEECIGSSSLVSNHSSDKSGKAIVRFSLLSFYNLGIDVITISWVNKAFNFDELGFCEFRH